MELSELTDDEVCTELGHAVAQLAEARRYLDDVLVEAADRGTIKHPRLMDIIGVRHRQFYNRLRDARFAPDRVTRSDDSQ